MKKKLISLALVLVMVVGMLPTVVFADGEPTNWSILNSAIQVTGDYAGDYANETTIKDGAETPLFTVKDETVGTVTTRTITLLTDFKAEAADTCLSANSAKRIVLDLNGHVLDRGLIDDDGTPTYTTWGCAIYVSKVLTLKDSNPNVSYKFTVLESGLWKYVGAWKTGEAETETVKKVNGGVITGGTGTNQNSNGKYRGGAINVPVGGTFTMNGGNLVGNYTRSGGGIATWNNKTNGAYFYMTNGRISGNVATSYSGGIALSCPSDGYFKAVDGDEIIITDNIAETSEGGVGSGDYDNILKMSGKIIIKDNYTKSTLEKYAVNNLGVSDRPLKIDGPLTGSDIDIVHFNINNDELNTGVLTSGFTTNNPGAKLNDIFHFDGPAGYVMDLRDDGELESFKITIAKTKFNTEEVENPVYGTPEAGRQLFDVKLNRDYPLDNFYVEWKTSDGTWSKNAPVTGLGLTVDGKVTTSAKTPAGEYVFRVTTGAGASKETTLTVDQQEAVVWATGGTSHVYDGNAKKITAMSYPNLKLDISYYSVDNDGKVGDKVTDPKDAGDYLYVINLDSGETNYAISDALDETELEGKKVSELEGGNFGIMTIASPSPTEYTVTVDPGANGNALASAEKATAGSTVRLLAVPNAGYTFDGWKVTNPATGGPTITNNAFIMPASNVTVQATWKAIPAPASEYTVTVNPGEHGTAIADKGSAKEGETVTLLAVPSDGYKFKEWKYTEAGESEKTLSGNTYTMVKKNVTFTATWEEVEKPATTYDVTVTTDGHGSALANYTKAAKNTVVSLLAVPDAGYEFDKWVVTVPAEEAKQPTITNNSFTMGEAAVTVKATFKAITQPTEYTVTVDANGGGSVLASTDKAVKGATVRLLAVPDATHTFDGWEVVSPTENKPTITNNAFAMPESNVEIKAKWKEIPAPASEYTVTVNPGEHGTAIADKGSAKEGETVTLLAVPSDGYKFKEWKYTEEGGSEQTLSGNTYTMGEKNVTFTATWEEVPAPATTYDVTVTTDGHGSALANYTKAAEGTVVSLLVVPDSGYELDTLTVTDADGETVVVTNNKFTMPGKAVSVTATFEKVADEEHGFLPFFDFPSWLVSFIDFIKNIDFFRNIDVVGGFFYYITSGIKSIFSL